MSFETSSRWIALLAVCLAFPMVVNAQSSKDSVPQEEKFTNPTSASATENPGLVEARINALAGKSKRKANRAEVVEELKGLEKEALPDLMRLLDSKDREIRFQSLAMLLDLEHTTDEVFSRAIGDSYFKLQVMPALHLAMKGVGDKDKEYLRWVTPLKKGFDETIFSQMLKALEVEELLYSTDPADRAKVPVNRKGDPYYARAYLKVIGKPATPYLIREIKRGNKSLTNIFIAIEAEHPEDRFGLDLLIAELVDYKSPPYNTDWNRTHYLAGSILTYAESHPEAFTEKDIAELSRFLDTRRSDPDITIVQKANIDSCVRKILQILKEK